MTTKQEWIASQLSDYPNQSAAEICSELNTKRLIDNPVPITQIPKPVSIDNVSALLDSETRFKVQQTETWKFILSDYSSGISKYFIANLENLLGGGIISQAQHDEILELLQETIPDPNYQAQIFLSPAEEAGFDLVYTDEINISPLLQ